MDCETAREAISAELDGEAAEVPPAELDEHLAHCASCQAWRTAAYEVTRRARLASARVSPRRTSEVLAAVLASARVRRRRIETVAAARAGLAVTAVGQIAIIAPILIYGRDHGAPGHVSREVGVFGAALAAGFLVAAWRPGRALGIRPVVGVAAVLLAVTAVADLIGGRTGLGDEAPHLLAIVGWLLIRHLAATCPPVEDGPLGPAPPWVRWLLPTGVTLHRRGVTRTAAATGRGTVIAWRRAERPAAIARGLPLPIDGGEQMREQAAG